MKFFISKEKITPDIPVLQSGFAARKHKSEGIYDDPYATVLIIKENKTVVIIALDLLYGDRSFAYGIKKSINEKYGLKQDEIIINYSHTHSVVRVTGEDEVSRSVRPYSISMDKFLWDINGKDIDYAEDIRYFNIIKTKIMNMLDKGFQNLIECGAYICKSKFKFGINRRYPSPEGILMKPNYDDNCIDTDLYLIKFVDINDNIIGLIYNYACHPVILGSGNYLISADYPGVVRKYLEKCNTGMTPIFLQGCGADINPYIAADKDRFKSCNFDELEKAGISLAKEIQRLIDNHSEKRTIENNIKLHENFEEKNEDCSSWKKVGSYIQTGYSEVKLYTEIWDIPKWESITNDPKEPIYIRESAKKVLLDIKKGKIRNYLPYYISILILGGRTYIIALEGEVVSNIGKSIKRILSNEDAIVLGYSNSSECYIPTRKILYEGGYESTSFISAKLAGPFAHETEDIIVGRAIAMAKVEMSNNA
ncbi:MAG TPA: hypothetical protein PK733_01565 [Clostridiales bacterium]|nr:hypothetical protein [Clostridiales bacterium]